MNATSDFEQECKPTHPQPSLFDIAGGILDDFEYTAGHLESADSVQAYADSAGRTITHDQADLILKLLGDWLTGSTHGSNAYYYEVQEPLEASDEVRS